jgi:hypothetical protein
LRIHIDQRNWAEASALRLHCQMAGQRGFPSSALLRRQNQNVHLYALSAP